MSATAQRPTLMVVPPADPPETVEVSRDTVDLLIAQNQDILTQLREIHDRQLASESHMLRQDGVLAEQDRQRLKMWEKVDQIAAGQADIAPVVKDILARLGIIEIDAPGIHMAAGVRRGLLWLGVIALGGIVTTLAAGVIGWIVNHSGAAFAWFWRGTP